MAKLDVTSTVSEAYRGAWSHFGDMVKLVWAPVTIYVAASVLHSNYLQQQLDAVDPQDQAAVLAAVSGWPSVAMILVSLFLWPVIAVAWHRFILLGEASSSALYFRFGQREARFLLTSIFISLLFLPGYLIIMLGGTMGEGSSSAGMFVLLGLALVIAGGVFALRLSLLLPAVATDGAVDAKGILEATQGNVWRIVGAHVLNLLILLVIGVLFSMVAGALAAFIGAVVGALASAVLMVFMQILSVAILSIMYRDLVLNSAHSNPVQTSLH